MIQIKRESCQQVECNSFMHSTGNTHSKSILPSCLDNILSISVMISHFSLSLFIKFLIRD